MSLYQITLEYILVFCTSSGLTTLGEPAPSSLPAAASASSSSPSASTPTNNGSNSSNHDSRPPMPVFIVLLFVFLAFTRWTLSFLCQYAYLVIKTTIIVSTAPIRTLDAATAHTHPDSQRERMTRLIRRVRVVGAFKLARTRALEGREATSRRLSQVTVPEMAALSRRSTAASLSSFSSPFSPLTPQFPQHAHQHHHTHPIFHLYRTLTTHPLFRGFAPLTTITIAQWLLAFTLDLLLSGQPSDLQLGYGSTSLILKTVFASAYAVWTHYCITKPSNKRVFDHFPKGGDVLIELWPLTALWCVAEHLTLSLPLALSRHWGLKRYAFDPGAWNSIPTSKTEVQLVLVEFATVWLLHVALTAVLAVPVTMMARRTHASMLSDEDLAIVPLHRGKLHRHKSFERKAEIKAPGLTAGEAWDGISWVQYRRVVGVYVQAWLAGQAVNWVYWWVNWRLQGLVGVGGYRGGTRLPWSPLGVVTADWKNQRVVMGGQWRRSEL